jgi:hypothetical protein
MDSNWTENWNENPFFIKRTTSWSLLGPGVEVGLAPNIMKGINIFTVDIIKDFSYKYDRIIQVLWKKGNKKKKIFTSKVFEMMPHGTLKFQIVFWALRPTSTKEKSFVGLACLGKDIVFGLIIEYSSLRVLAPM